MIQVINSKENPKIKDVVKLSRQSERIKRQEFVIEGFHLLDMALKTGLVKSVFVLKKNKEIPFEIEQYIVSKDIMRKISTEVSPQGVVAVCKFLPKNITSFSNKVLYLDGVSDPGNLGTLLRTALAFSYKTVILSENTCSIYNQKVIQSSQGAIFNLNVISDDGNIIDLLKLKQYQIISTEINGSELLCKIKAENKHVLVLGNEAHGVSKNILNKSDLRVRININEIESLNVAIAGAITMYEFSK